MKKPYRYEARNVNAFVDQVVRLLGRGYFRCARIRIPENKDARAIVEKVIKLYDVEQPRWRRERRNLKKSAAVHLVWYGQIFVLMVSKGRHDLIENDHGSSMLNLKKSSLKVFGYSIKRDERTGKVNVRLDAATYRQLKSHLLTISVWHSYLDRERLEREFRRLPYQPYAPVYVQLCSIARQVNAVRRRRGFEAIDVGACVRKFQTIERVFVETDTA